MFRNWSMADTAASLIVFPLLLCIGCNGQAKRVKAPSLNPTTVGKAALEQFDVDKDGKIAGDEFEKCPSLKRLDAGEGVTASMIEAEIKKWQESRLGRTTYNICVKKKGKPLSGATVKYVPEKFLGDTTQTAIGKTGNDGIASMEIPEQTPPGIALGFYRVEITKDGDTIPAQYNTETTLSAAVRGSGAGINDTFNLEY